MEWSFPGHGLGVPASVVETIIRRTPGFAGWQQERWRYHCVVQDMRELYADPRRDIEGFLAALDRDHPPSAYLFRCRHCDRHLFYTDTT